MKMLLVLLLVWGAIGCQPGARSAADAKLDACADGPRPEECRAWLRKHDPGITDR